MNRNVIHYVERWLDPRKVPAPVRNQVTILWADETISEYSTNTRSFCLSLAKSICRTETKQIN